MYNVSVQIHRHLREAWRVFLGKATELRYNYDHRLLLKQGRKEMETREPFFQPGRVFIAIPC